MRRKQTVIFGVVVFVMACVLGLVIETNTPRQFTVEDDTLANPGITGLAPSRSPLPAANSKININTATVEELERLDGIGEKLSERIIRYREEHGAYTVIEDIMRVSGIGEKKFENIKDDICVE